MPSREAVSGMEERMNRSSAASRQMKSSAVMEKQADTVGPKAVPEPAPVKTDMAGVEADAGTRQKAEAKPLVSESTFGSADQAAVSAADRAAVPADELALLVEQFIGVCDDVRENHISQPSVEALIEQGRTLLEAETLTAADATMVAELLGLLELSPSVEGDRWSRVCNGAVEFARQKGYDTGKNRTQQGPKK